jgi:bifunctional DNA-binding transcriptional regulator/antitoxin component of YhaV-PrlF toxin-antitoxin module
MKCKFLIHISPVKRTMNEAEKLEFEADVDSEGRIRISEAVQKSARVKPGSIVTARIKTLLDRERKPIEGPACELVDKFEFTDQVDDEGHIRIPDTIKKAALISPGSIVRTSIEHVLDIEEKPDVYKFEFVDKVDDENRIRIPDAIKKAALISPGSVVSIRLKHVLDTENKPVEILVEEVDKFDFTAEVDDEGRISIPETMQKSVPLSPGSIVSVRMEHVLDTK